MARTNATLTLSGKLESAAGHPSGFDYLRVALAVAVVLWHEVPICYGNQFTSELWHSWFRPFPTFIIPMFFALSGFLVAGSLERCKTLFSFLALRALRIFPALCVEVCLSGLILGPLATTLPIGEYLGSVQFAQYFLNILGDIHYNLPGVFADNPQPGIVNGQLWTVPFELECYIAIAVLVALRFVKLNTILLAVVVLAHAVLLARAVIGSTTTELAVSGRVLVIVFLTGVAFYRNRSQIPYSAPLAILCFVLACILFYIPKGFYMCAIPVTYLTVYIGLSSPHKSILVTSGDYSYGIFLFGYPIQQAVASMGPWVRHYPLHFLLAFPLIVVFAIMSWHIIERPVLRNKSRIKRAEDLWLSRSLRPLPADPA